VVNALIAPAKEGLCDQSVYRLRTLDAALAKLDKKVSIRRLVWLQNATLEVPAGTIDSVNTSHLTVIRRLINALVAPYRLPLDHMYASV
jgi:hypothetical protein